VYPPFNYSCLRQVIKIRILTHHGNEYYCTMSAVMVYGTTQWEEMGRALEENEQQVTIVKRVLDGVSSQEKEKGQDKPLNAADANATAAAASKAGAQISWFTSTNVQKLTSPLMPPTQTPLLLPPPLQQRILPTQQAHQRSLPRQTPPLKQVLTLLAFRVQKHKN